VEITAAVLAVVLVLTIRGPVAKVQLESFGLVM
jgi:hypothetical protein